MKGKRIVYSLAVVISLLVLSGCGKEQILRCKATESKVDVGYNVTFKGSRITKMDLSYDMDLTSYTDAQIKLLEEKDFCEVVKTSMSQYKDAFMNCNDTIANKHLSVIADLSVDKIANNELEKFSSIEKSKEELEKMGYTCTIE